MGQKVHPVAVRLNQNRKFDASWYNENYLNTYKEELLIRKAIHFFFQILSQNIPNLFLGRIFLQQSHQKTLITIFLYKNLIRGKRKNRFSFKYSKKNKKNKQQQQKNYHSSTLFSFASSKFFSRVSEQRNETNILQSKFLDQFYRKLWFSHFFFSKPLNPQLRVERKNLSSYKRQIFASQSSLFFESAILKTAYLTFLRSQNCLSVKNHCELFFKKYVERKKDSKAFLNNQKTHPLFSYFEDSLGMVLNKNIILRPVIIDNLNCSALFLAEQISQILKKNQKKKKIPYKLIKKLISGHPSLGIRIQCSGRLGGVEMAKKFFLKKGQTSLNVFSQKIDFAQRTALTKYGIIGIKIWVSHQQKLRITSGLS